MEKVRPQKYDQHQFDWQAKARLMDAISCKQYESEDLLQADCFGWFNHYLRTEAFIAAIPNGGFRVKAEAIKLLATGVRPGASDLFLLLPVRRAYWLECKNRKDIIDPDQVIFKETVEAMGFEYYMFNTFNQFRCLVQFIMEIPEERFQTLI